MDCQKQGTDFLSKHNIEMKVKFIKYAPYFSADKKSRDIFKITFMRIMEENKPCIDSAPFSITFGQSLNDSTGSGNNPSFAYDILACITKSDPEDFQFFCDDYDYDSDSIKALKIYKNVKKEWEKVKNFFTQEEIEELQEIQ